LIYRPDGLIVTRHLAQTQSFEFEKGDEIEAVLDLGSLQLVNGDYLLSVGMWADIDSQHIEPSSYYHHIDRSYKFQVVGNPPMHDELFVHPGTWSVKTQPSRAAQMRLARQVD
jgi:hypothetical protein